MPAKTKTQQKENLDQAQGRDLFQTPNYATDLLVPFLSQLSSNLFGGDAVVWECAAGEKKMSNRLRHHGFDVVETDIQYQPSHNFLTDDVHFDFDIIVTNTPFSLKKKFFDKCIQHDVPFALLLPADYALWIIEAVEEYGCEKIIPTRRIDYITPNTLYRIWEGESWNKTGIKTCTLKEWKKAHTEKELKRLLDDGIEFKFDSIYDAPTSLLRKYSSSDFHSMWLTRGFDLGRSETFVELTNKMKDNI